MDINKENEKKKEEMVDKSEVAENKKDEKTSLISASAEEKPAPDKETKKIKACKQRRNSNEKGYCFEAGFRDESKKKPELKMVLPLRISIGKALW